MLNLDINKPDLPYVFHLLVPGFKFEGYFPDNWEWTDERPQPTKEEIKKTWKKFVRDYNKKVLEDQDKKRVKKSFFKSLFCWGK